MIRPITGGRRGGGPVVRLRGLSVGHVPVPNRGREARSQQVKGASTIGRAGPLREVERPRVLRTPRDPTRALEDSLRTIDVSLGVIGAHLGQIDASLGSLTGL